MKINQFAIIFILTCLITISCRVNNINSKETITETMELFKESGNFTEEELKEIEQELKNSEKTTQTDSPLVKIKGEEFVTKLDSLGYFRYTRTEQVDSLKNTMLKTFNSFPVLTTINSEISPYLPIDYRLYNCDGETLFEVGGLAEYLDELKHTFTVRGLKLEYSNEKSKEKGDFWDHRITINGKEYSAFKGTMNTINVWGIATANFVKMLNDQLELQRSDDRVYPISGGNQGELVFLSKQQYEFISIVCTRNNEGRPLELNEWKQWNNIK
jgi:hypothetical protein